MRTMVVIVLLLGAWDARSSEGGFPWEEWKTLFREAVVREVGDAVDVPTMSVAMDEAKYQIRLRADRAEGEVTMTGTYSAGDPIAIPLFGSPFVWRASPEVTGGRLIPGAEEAGTLLLPDAGAPGLNLTATFFARVTEERGTRSLTLAIPGAVNTTLELQLDDGLRLLETPGIPGENGTYHLGTVNSITVRYALGGGVADEGPAVDLSTLTPMDQRQVVLESQSLRVTFDETGRSLSTLYLVVPPEAGAQLKLSPVAGSEIWSLSVNGVAEQVYTGEDGAWIVPLESGRESRVELAFLREGDPVVLQGKLEVAVPGTGLAARHLYVGVDLPGRVRLMSVEGPITTAALGTEGLPTGVTGAPYIFTHPFYKGEGMSIAVSYKEPVNNH